MSSLQVNPDAPLIVAIDAMGGDFAPAEVVKGAALYVSRTPDQNSEMLLVGDADVIARELTQLGFANNPRLRTYAASQVIGMDEHPAEALRHKPDASLVVCNALVKSGQAHVSFSAGNTGAMLISATTILERIEGVRRPAIATLMPTETGGRAVVVDAGANVDCKPSYMVHFALLGSVYAERALGIPNPRVGLLANGEEEGKGNAQTREAFHLLQAARPRINFIGNVEGNHVFEGGVDVVVCDGFVGNVLLKSVEGIVRVILGLMSQEANHAESEAARDTLLQTLLRLRIKVDYSEFGGAPLLGVDGAAFIAHGRSDKSAIASGIAVAVNATRSGYVSALRDAFADKTDKNGESKPVADA